MRLLHALVIALLAGASLASTEHARAQDTAPCTPDPSLDGPAAEDTDDDLKGAGGPGAGGDASGVLPFPANSKTCGTGLTSALGPSRAIAAWFSALSPNDRAKFMREAEKAGVVDRDGRPFSEAEFQEMARYFDEAMTRQGMKDAAKLKLLRMMADDAGITDANKAETHDVHGG